ncbi:MAG: type II toxin-antitoxin system PemK/MazF family toxin [Acidobacteriota bacterium]|nr:type II toxin-antitoxin system PemK/MazF family toxin [Acidobacteriota bacterium]
MFDLDPKKGREQKGVRPCLVVSTDALNRSDFGTVILCPVTTTDRPRFQWRVAVSPGDLRLAGSGWEPKTHWVETDQIVTVDTSRRALRRLATVVDEEKLRLVDDSLRMMLNL